MNSIIALRLEKDIPLEELLESMSSKSGVRQSYRKRKFGGPIRFFRKNALLVESKEPLEIYTIHFEEKGPILTLSYFIHDRTLIFLKQPSWQLGYLMGLLVSSYIDRGAVLITERIPLHQHHMYRRFWQVALGT